MNTLRLVELNSLVCTQSGVWALPGEATSFGYSDGDAEEANLKSILANATDLSSLSLELEEKHNDWTSEYHLSPLRANLLRYLDFTNKKAVLELGCGCGALTRYLGEQGLAVDAIEGSQRRANLAKIRCQELSNVDVIASNFFNLSLPANHYDAVLFVGVMEYAGRFSPSDTSAEASVIQLLEKIRPSLTAQGIILIAIENRLGRKYFCGAGEDHYGTAFEGIHGYPNYSGIKTWSQDEWSALLEDVELTFSFHYPFPDYKLPSLILNERYLKHDPNAWARLTGISSRDYHGLISPQDDLPFWHRAHQVGCLGAFANSFLIVAGTNREQVKRLTPFDFVQTSSLSRKPSFRTQTRRYVGVDIVEKVYLHESVAANDSPFHHALGAEPWRNGIPLSNVWMQRLRINPSHKHFVELSTEYYNYLNSRFDNTPTSGELVDVLPMNIMVTPSGVWHPFDHEWTITTPIDTEFIFFRGLFYFCQGAQEILRAVYHNKPEWTLQTGLDAWFSAVGLNLELNLDKFIEWEETIQNTVLRSRKGVSTRDFLRLKLSAPRQTVQLFWSLPKETFTEFQSQTNYISVGNDLQHVSFVLPEDICPPIGLRFDPGVENGVFSIKIIRIYWLGNESSTCLQTLCPGKLRDRNLLTFENISPHPSGPESLFCALNQDPYVSWQLPNTSARRGGGPINVEIILKWLSQDPNDSSPPTDPDNFSISSPSRRRFSSRNFGLLAVLKKRWRSLKEGLQRW